jgi:protein gp37
LTKFGKAEQELFREQQNLIMMLTSVMREFRASPSHTFYILTKKSSRVFHFRHTEGDTSSRTSSTLTICNLSERMYSEL